jgi:hypothetical protein
MCDNYMWMCVLEKVRHTDHSKCKSYENQMVKNLPFLSPGTESPALQDADIALSHVSSFFYTQVTILR